MPFYFAIFKIVIQIQSIRNIKKTNRYRHKHQQSDKPYFDREKLFFKIKPARQQQNKQQNENMNKNNIHAHS